MSEVSVYPANHPVMRSPAVVDDFNLSDVIGPRAAAAAAGGGSSNAYRDAVLADSPTHYWRLAETSGTNADEVVECVATVLSAAPTTVAVSLPGLPIGAQSLFAHDPRVHLGTLPPSLQDRALVAVELRRPIRFGPGSFDCILDRLRPGGPARLTVCDGEHDLMTCVATRAERRVARWAPRVDAGSLWTELFGPPERCTPHEVDVEPVTSPVDLALTFPR